MSFNFARILQNKREFGQHLAARRIAEKLALLDVLRERALRDSSDLGWFSITTY